MYAALSYQLAYLYWVAEATRQYYGERGEKKELLVYAALSYQLAYLYWVAEATTHCSEGKKTRATSVCGLKLPVSIPVLGGGSNNTLFRRKKKKSY